MIRSVPFGSHQFAGKGKEIVEMNVGLSDEMRAKEGYRPLARNNFLGVPRQFPNCLSVHEEVNHVDYAETDSEAAFERSDGTVHRIVLDQMYCCWHFVTSVATPVCLLACHQNLIQEA